VRSHSENFDNVDVGELYGSPVSWDCFDEVVSHVAYEDPVYGYAFDADEVAWLDLDGSKLSWPRWTSGFLQRD
jgi:hypothetical protein